MKETIVLKFGIEPTGKNSNIVFICLKFVTNRYSGYLSHPFVCQKISYRCFISHLEENYKNKIEMMFDDLSKWKPEIHNGEAVRSIWMPLFKFNSGEVVLPPCKTPSF